MDFYQDIVTSIHALTPRFDDHVRQRVRQAVQKRPAGLVIPMLYEELEKPALTRIAKEIAGADFLNETYIALGAENEGQVKRTVEFFERHNVDAKILWVENPRIMAIWNELEEKGLDLGHFTGKGFAVWTAIGAASLDNHGIVLHDADVETYGQHFLSRLLLPVVAPDMDFFYVKGSYARITDDRLFGRVVRLFVWPMLDALLQQVENRSPFLNYLRAFRYPLSGEFAITSDLAMNVRVPTDWGLEVGLLGEVYRNASLKRVCQMDLGVYSHKHQSVGTTVSEGLLKMTADISTTILRTLTENEGYAIDEGRLLALRILYRRMAQDSVRKYYVDAVANGLTYDRHVEEQTIDAFADVVEHAGRGLVANPGREQIPDWLRVMSADDSVRERVKDTAFQTKIA